MSVRRSQGFTLIEVIGAFFMMAVILIFVTGIFVENGRQRSVATELMRVHTTSASTLDLIAQDLEATLYIAPQGAVANRDHSWVFRADRAGPSGATFLRFQTQNMSRDQLAEHASTWVEVVYFLTEDEEPDHFTLWRWRSTRPPSDANPRDPDPDDPASARVVDGVADFGVTFVGAESGLVEEWDSTFAPQDSPLPIGAEIRLALFRQAREGESEDGELDIPDRARVRHVSLPMHRPINIERLVELAQTGENETGCATIDDCRELGDDDNWYFDARDECDGVDSPLCEALGASGSTCWDDLAGLSSEIVNSAPVACDSLQ